MGIARIDDYKAYILGLSFRVLFVGSLTIMFTITPHLFAQSLTDWPMDYVALYDCNTSTASTDNMSQIEALNSASKFILQDILSDSSSHQVFLLKYGFADTGIAQTTFQNTSFPLPDTGASPDAEYDFVIASKITGSPGSYTLTVSIQDGYSYTHVTDGTATFGSATSGDVETACRSAVQQILPLTTKIRSYQELLKTANPSLIINAQIEVAPVKLTLPLDGSTDVVITTTDCNGTPIPGQELTLESTRGSFGTSTVITDETGKATVAFNAGESAGMAILTATIQSAVTVTHDTATFSGQGSLMIGEIDTTNLWVLKFDMHRSWSGYRDKITDNAEGTDWEQKTTFWTQSAYGTFMGTPNGDGNNEFYFSDTSLSVRGEEFDHTLTKATYKDKTGNECPQTSWVMSGISQTYVAKVNSDESGEASFEYSPGFSNLFVVEIPYTTIDAYAYNWSITGRWENGRCETSSDHQGMRLKWFNVVGGVGGSDLFGPDPGFSIVPFYSGSAIVGYSILIMHYGTGYTSDGTFYETRDECSATLRPFSKTTGVKGVEPPKGFSLSQNYPNPFNPTTTISYQLPKSSIVTLNVYDVLGRQVSTLVSERQNAGSHTVNLNAGNLPSGVYLYRIQAGAFSSMKKMLLVK
jgi:Secretion system C-terminal sorting domain